METRKEQPSSCREVEARSEASTSGGGNSIRLAPAPHPKNASDFSTSPQGRGEIVALARAWIGTPYLHQASVKGVGCDCLGLLRGVWRELRGAEPQAVPPYSPDWAEATARETLHEGLARYLDEIGRADVAEGDIVLFRMRPRAPAKHCGIVAEKGGALTLIHARQNRRVCEEVFSPSWRRKLAFAFRVPWVGSRAPEVS